MIVIGKAEIRANAGSFNASAVIVSSLLPVFVIVNEITFDESQLIICPKEIFEEDNMIADESRLAVRPISIFGRCGSEHSIVKVADALPVKFDLASTISF